MEFASRNTRRLRVSYVRKRSLKWLVWETARPEKILQCPRHGLWKFGGCRNRSICGGRCISYLGQTFTGRGCQVAATPPSRIAKLTASAARRQIWKIHGKPGEHFSGARPLSKYRCRNTILAIKRNDDGSTRRRRNFERHAVFLFFHSFPLYLVRRDKVEPSSPYENRPRLSFPPPLRQSPTFCGN